MMQISIVMHDIVRFLIMEVHLNDVFSVSKLALFTGVGNNVSFLI